MAEYAIYKHTDGRSEDHLTREELTALAERLGDRMADSSHSYDSDDGDYEVHEVYAPGETQDDYPDGDPYADAIYVPYVWDDEVKAAAAALGRKGGRVSSPAKVAAARKNAKLGGRPKGSRNMHATCRHPRAYVTSRDEGYRPIAAKVPDPRAAGGITVIEHCSKCGARRLTNVNQDSRETTGWRK